MAQVLLTQMLIMTTTTAVTAPLTTFVFATAPQEMICESLS